MADVETVAKLIDANRKLSRSVAELQTFFDLSLDLLAIAEEGKFIKLSKSWEDATGWTCEELMDRPFVYFVDEDDVDATMNEDTRIERTEKSTIDFVNRYRTKDGGTITLEWRSKALNGTTYAVARIIDTDH